MLAKKRPSTGTSPNAFSLVAAKLVLLVVIASLLALCAYCVPLEPELSRLRSFALC